jgi:hypothetical protein
MMDHNPADPESLRRATEDYERRRRERMKISHIRIVRPTTDENLRLLNQGGAFTQAPAGVDIEAFVRENFKDEAGTPILLKIGIAESDERDCLVALSRMATNHRALFP